MNTATAEPETSSQTEFYQAEIQRMGVEMERILNELAESRGRCERLSAETDEILAANWAMLKKQKQPAPVSSHP